MMTLCQLKERAMIVDERQGLAICRTWTGIEHFDPIGVIAPFDSMSNSACKKISNCQRLFIRALRYLEVILPFQNKVIYCNFIST